MANASILWEIPTDSGAWANGAWQPTLPIGNMTTQDPQEVARTIGVTTTATQWRIDCGASPIRVFSQFVLLNHNISTAGTIRFVLNSASTDNVGTRLYDSGQLPAWEVTTAWGAQPWGTFPWNGRDPTPYPGGTAIIHTTPTNDQGFFGGIAARYLFVYITDTTNPAGFIQVGRFMAGSAWQPEINYEPGAGLRWVDPAVKRRTRGGNPKTTDAVKYRTIDLKFPRINKQEAMGFFFEMNRQLGKAKEMFIMMNPDEPGNFRFRRSLYGTLVDTTDIPEEFGDNFPASISVEEIV